MDCPLCESGTFCPVHDRSVCNCIRQDCWHPAGRCEEPPSMMYGSCSTCRHYVAPKPCPTCGQPMPVKP